MYGKLFYIIITGSHLVIVCVMVTRIEDGNMVPEALENYICMVRCYNIIAGSYLVFVCLMVTRIEDGYMVPETLDNYICMVSC